MVGVGDVSGDVGWFGGADGWVLAVGFGLVGYVLGCFLGESLVGILMNLRV
jgi:hypothetical protein